MSIRNRDNIIRVCPDSVIVKSYPELEFEDHFTDNEYYCIYFVEGKLLELAERFIPAEIIDEVKNQELHLLISNNLEGTLDFIDHVHKFIDRLDIPASKVTVLTSAYDLPTSTIKTVVTDAFELIQQSKQSSPKVKTDFKKRFIYPNHRWRLHRPALVALLANRNLLDHGYISLRLADDNLSWESCHDSVVSKYPELENFDMSSIPELYIDEAEFNVGYPEELSKHFYEQSCFSIVSETNFYSPSSRFFSEKTYKNIEYEMPFILVSRPHSLSLLRDKGYKTFSPYINEDYDTIEDDDQRLLMIANEIERLCSLPEHELLEVVDQLRPICEYNRQVLINKKYPDDFIWHTL